MPPRLPIFGVNQSEFCFDGPFEKYAQILKQTGN